MPSFGSAMPYLYAFVGMAIRLLFQIRYLCSSLLQKWTNLQHHLAVSRSDGKTSSVVVGCLRTLGDLRAAFFWTMFNVWHWNFALLDQANVFLCSCTLFQSQWTFVCLFLVFSMFLSNVFQWIFIDFMLLLTSGNMPGAVSRQFSPQNFKVKLRQI